VLDVIDAGARAAVAMAEKGVGVIGTPTTINSNAYARSIHALNPDIHVHSQACPLFVPLVEEGWLDNEVTRLTAQEYLKPVFVEQIDTLVLGCTHYPLLKPLLQEVAGNAIRLVDSATTVADQTSETLDKLGLHNPQRSAPEYRYFVTDIPLRFQTVGGRFLGRELTQLEQVHW
jgi:glutamate racemase